MTSAANQRLNGLTFSEVVVQLHGFREDRHAVERTLRRVPEYLLFSTFPDGRTLLHFAANNRSVGYASGTDRTMKYWSLIG